MRIATVEKQGERIICGAEDPERARRIAEATLEILGWSKIEEHRPEELSEKIVGIRESYVEKLEDPKNSMNYHLRKGSSKIDRKSFIDWWTLVSEEERERIIEILMELLEKRQAYREIDRKDDIEPVLEKTIPLVGRHGLKKLVGDRVWEKAKEKEKLSEPSQRTLKNAENGREFERFFRKLCERNGMICYRRSSEAFRTYLPEKYREVRKEKGNMKGIPDFLVDRKNSTTLENWSDSKSRFWEPENRFAFVEVKYNSSRPSKDQRKMAELLEKHGVEVLVFKGTKENYRLEDF